MENVLFELAEKHFKDVEKKTYPNHGFSFIGPVNKIKKHKIFCKKHYSRQLEVYIAEIEIFLLNKEDMKVAEAFIADLFKEQIEAIVELSVVNEYFYPIEKIKVCTTGENSKAEYDWRKKGEKQELKREIIETKELLQRLEKQYFEEFGEKII